MQDHYASGDETATEHDAPLWTPTLRRRALLALIAALCIVLLVVVPPSVSINRYQHRVAASISGALGRPVHFDSISLRLLPVPGLTISNFVVSESPEFGYEPVLRANTVEARLRVSSLWRRRLEVSRISLDAPSINLVRRTDDGRWNLQSILMQASQLHSAPTAQQRAGDAPRFPYIEATDARINIKSGDSKLPFSVKEAEFALWLPEPDQWRLRMVGKPVRTDTDVNDVGLLRVEGTLGRAADLENAPVNLQAGWKMTPLGEAAKLTAGYDLGWRGEIAATASLHGTLGAGRLVTDVHLHSLHRADFLPEHNAEVDAHCEAVTAGLLRSLHDVRCAVPTDNSLSIAGVMDALRSMPVLGSATHVETPDSAVGNGTIAGVHASSAKPGVLLLQGEMPNVLDWRTASGSITLHHAAADYALTWAELFTRSLPATLQVGGAVDFSASLLPGEGGLSRWTGLLTCLCTLPRPNGDTTSAMTAGPNLWGVRFALQPDVLSPDVRVHVSAEATPQQPVANSALDAGFETVPPNECAPIHGTLAREGFDLYYDTRSDVHQTAILVPRLGEGLTDAESEPLEARGGWYTPQSWMGAASLPRVAPTRKHHHR